MTKTYDVPTSVNSIFAGNGAGVQLALRLAIGEKS